MVHVELKGDLHRLGFLRILVCMLLGTFLINQQKALPGLEKGISTSSFMRSVSFFQTIVGQYDSKVFKLL